MIPLGDSDRRPLRLPIATTSIIAINICVFLLELLGGDAFINLAQIQSGGVAYMAHIGGFIFGALTTRIFETRERRTQLGLDP